MKTRSGFVSNSSSSSFVVRRDDLSTKQLMDILTITGTRYSEITKNGEIYIEFPESYDLPEYFEDNKIDYEKRF